MKKKKKIVFHVFLKIMKNGLRYLVCTDPFNYNVGIYTCFFFFFFFFFLLQTVPSQRMTSLVLRSCVIFLVIIVSGTWSYFTGDPNNKGKYMPEKCWAKKYICENLSGDGLGYRHNTCLFR